MTALAVTLVSAAGWLVGAVVLVRLWDTQAPEPLALDPDAPVLERAKVVAARTTGAMVGSIVAGVLTIGCGGRLMMRLLAATSSDAVQGAITDMDAVVGQPSIAGSIGFVVFVGIGVGLIGWGMRAVFRRWLPRRSVIAGLMGAGIGAGLLARNSGLLNPDSVDFVLLSPVWFAVLMIVAMITSFGMLQAVLADHWSATWPTPTTGRQLVYVAPLLLVMPLPPAAIAAIAAVFARAKLGSSPTRWTIRADRVLPVVTSAATAVGAVVTLAAAVEILIS